MSLTHFISLPEAARRLRATATEVRSMVASGKIDGGVLPDGETMVVSEDSLPTRKEDLPEYKKYEHLKGVGIGIGESAKKYAIAKTTVFQWYKKGYISLIERSGQKVLMDEQDVAYCVEIYRQNGSQGRRLFNSDGTPYRPRSVAG